MSDLISRKAAIEEANAWLLDCFKVQKQDRSCGLIRRLEDLPSAQPERKKGEWEIYVISMIDGEGCRCSECGQEGVPYWNFCPNCGADMRGGEE